MLCTVDEWSLLYCYINMKVFCFVFVCLVIGEEIWHVCGRSVTRIGVKSDTCRSSVTWVDEKCDKCLEDMAGLERNHYPWSTACFAATLSCDCYNCPYQTVQSMSKNRSAPEWTQITVLKWNDCCFRPRFCNVRLYCAGVQSWRMRWIWLWILLSLAHNRSLGLLSSSPARYHCITDAPSTPLINGCSLTLSKD